MYNMSIERTKAIVLANKVLDRDAADPDDDLAVLSRQLLRAQEEIYRLVTLRQDALARVEGK